MEERQLKCESCEEEVKEGEFYFIYRFTIITREKEYNIGVKNILTNLGDYLMQRGCHLSASEIMLLRPDIVQEFLVQLYKDEEVKCWYFEGVVVCYDCYEEYKKIVSLL